MAKSRTTNVAYYFARRKDTGMMGVWFTHCATKYQQERICWRLTDKAIAGGHPVFSANSDVLDNRFKVSFLEDNFVATVREYVRDTANSVSLDLTLKTLQEVNPTIFRMP